MGPRGESGVCPLLAESSIVHFLTSGHLPGSLTLENRVKKKKPTFVVQLKLTQCCKVTIFQ